MTNIHHTIDYVELGVGGTLAETRAFYEQAFGWAFNDYGPAYAAIRWSTGDGEVGGLNAAREGGRGGPLVLLYSDDLDATVAAVQAAGGAVVEAPYEFPGGRRFHFTDPAGNELGVWAAR
ncbi:VOC family protein [Nocardioides sp. URHA0020]|uniref:VOC family protein n=1 Tax=Nocardioides sp. URHA0020 TaxID=1380392 RepID=UPI00048B68E3|nr:VOC family protein [Nocardioides sp. URHA0020]